MSVTAIATKAKSSKAWSVEQALEDLLAEIRSGKTKPVQLALIYMEDTDEGRRRPGYVYAGCSIAESIALHVLAQIRGVEDWRD